MSDAAGTVLWWGRFDPDYSRNRILRQTYAALGWRISDFQPWLSAIGDVETLVRRAPPADLVHVPCFRQRDIAAARRYARRLGLPLLVDPLISAYDKQVFERGKLVEGSSAAQRLLHREQQLLQSADAVLADTPEHARFFTDTLGVDPARLHVVYVGAEETLFAPGAARAPNPVPEVLFYGSFIPLQGPEVIVEAARRYQGPPVRWTLLGDGPLREACRQQAAVLDGVTLAPWVPYELLPTRIRQADILLGVFGTTPKTQRVIPNKAFQALACGKPLVTCRAPAYPDGLLALGDSGIRWVPAGDAVALAAAVAELAAQPQRLAALGAQARASYEKFFAAGKVNEQLRAALATLALTRG